jgi:hypothetical protein
MFPYEHEGKSREDVHNELQKVLYAPLEIQNQGCFQRPARAGKRLILVLEGGNYMTYPFRESDNRTLAHGLYVFTIKQKEPHILYCALDNDVQGHTSISGGSNVDYAGEIVIVNGQLLRWSNNSGHYTPPASRNRVNISPPLRRLLPHEKFIEFG